LGGRLILRQPRRGHRVGHDAILLAAATQARAGEQAVDLGAGVGAAGLALARRVDGLKVTLVDNDETLVGLAGENIRANGLAQRVAALALDVTAPARAFTAAGLDPEAADRILMNPPFNDPQRLQSSPDARRRAAHVGGGQTLALWVKTANRLLRPGGTLTLIVRADGIADLLATLASGFGALGVLPVHPKPVAPAIRAVVRAIKGSRAPLVLLPGLVLSGDDGRPTRLAEAALRDGAALCWDASRKHPLGD